MNWKAKKGYYITGYIQPRTLHVPLWRAGTKKKNST